MTSVLSKYNRMGFDMVAFSGGKALLGPNDTGLLLGRLGRVRGTGDQGLLISVFMLKPGEVEIVARQLAAVLSDAAT